MQIRKAYWLRGTVPAKKNGKLLTRGRVITDPTKQNQLKGITLELLAQRNHRPLTKVVVDAEFFVSSARGDLDNKLTSVLDCLKEARVIEDDSMRHVRKLQASALDAEPGGEQVIISVTGEELN